MLGDNETSLSLMKNLEIQNCTKRINMIYHHITEIVEGGKLEIE